MDNNFNDKEIETKRELTEKEKKEIAELWDILRC